MLYRFQFELSDVDRGVYETLDFRTAQHPSENAAYLLTRALAYALSYEPGLNFTPGGLADPEAPALQSTGTHGTPDLWIEIGNPSARKLHKASKSAQRVIVYTYKSAELLLKEINGGEVHRARDIQVYAVDSKLMSELESHLEKNNRWSILHQQGRLDIDTGAGLISGEIRRFTPGAED